MPSTLFHLGLAGLIAAAVLDVVDRRALAVVAAAVLLPEIDTVAGLWIRGAHRAMLNNVWLPLGLAALLYHDTRRRDRSWLRARWGADAPRIAWTGVVVLAVAGIGGDLFFNGVNLFWPLHDRFYRIDGTVLLSTERGLVENIVDRAVLGGTDAVQYRTGVDPDPASPGHEPGADRVFPVATSGSRLLVSVVGIGVLGYRYRRDR